MPHDFSLIRKNCRKVVKAALRDAPPKSDPEARARLARVIVPLMWPNRQHDWFVRMPVAR